MQASEREMIEGQRVKVKLYGDEEWYSGIVLDRPRKMWVELDSGEYPYFGCSFIADENCIEDWYPL